MSKGNINLMKTVPGTQAKSMKGTQNTHQAVPDYTDNLRMLSEKNAEKNIAPDTRNAAAADTMETEKPLFPKSPLPRRRFSLASANPHNEIINTDLINIQLTKEEYCWLKRIYVISPFLNTDSVIRELRSVPERLKSTNIYIFHIAVVSAIIHMQTLYYNFNFTKMYNISDDDIKFINTTIQDLVNDNNPDYNIFRIV